MDRQTETEKTLKEIYCLLQKHLQEYIEYADKCTELKQNNPKKSGHSIRRPVSDPTDKRPNMGDQPVNLHESSSPCTCKCHVQIASSSEVKPHDIFTKSEEYGNESEMLGKELVYNRKETNQSPSTLTSDQIQTFSSSCHSDVNTLDSYHDDESESTHQRTRVLCNQNLDILRENVELKIQMQEIAKLIKRLPREEDLECNVFASINEILSKVICTQKRSEILCDKLCEGLSKSSKNMERLPKELSEFCDKIAKTIGQEYRQLGHELHLTPEEINAIDNDYEDVDDCLYQVILQWSRKSEDPSYHTLVTACNKVNPDILNTQPLNPLKVKVLEKCYRSLCDELLEAPILPHLISTGVMSFKQQQYVLKAKTADQRVSCLINIICTREQGFDELLKALDITYQGHVSNFLRTTLTKMEDGIHSDGTPSQPVVEGNQEHYQQSNQALSLPKLRIRRGSSNSLDLDDIRSVDSVFSVQSSPVIADPHSLLNLIYELIVKSQNR